MSRLRRSEVARRQHRRRQLFAAGEGSTAPVPYPDLPKVQILLTNGTWLDISTDVRYQNKINITVGRQATDTRVRAGSCAFTLDNRGALTPYSPRVPTSSNYALIGRNTQVIVSHRQAIRFWGEIPEWPPSGEKGGFDATVAIQAAGILRRLLASNAPTLLSASRRSIPRTNNLVAYWHMEDGTSSAFWANLADPNPASAMVPQGSGTTFASVTDNPGSAALPNFGTAGGSGASIKSYAIASSWRVAFDFKTPNITAANTCSTASWALLNSTMIRFEVWIGNISGLAADFEVAVRIIFSGGTATVHRSNITISPTGAWHHVDVEMAQNGANVTGTVTVDGVVGTAITEAAVSIGSVVATNFNAPSDLGTPAFITASGGQFAVWQPAPNNYPNGYAASTGYNAEAAGRRIERLCREESISFVAVGNLDDTNLMGPQGQRKLVDLFYDAEDADQGIFGEATALFGLQYRTRVSLYNQQATAALNYAASGNVDTVLVPATGDQRIINDSTVTRSGGGATQIMLATGAMSILDPSQGGIGRYPEGPTYNLASDSQTADVAGWRVRGGTIDKQRFDKIEFNFSNMMDKHGNITLGRSILGLDLGDLVTVDNQPIWIPPGQLQFIFVGRSEVFDQIEHTMSANTILGEPYQVGVLDDPILGHLESDGTTVSGAQSSGATSFSAVTATGEVWITAAMLATFSPPEVWTNFDVFIGGERITVLDISGASSPQTWTVVRSINGVIKAIPDGAAITLANPLILGM